MRRAYLVDPIEREADFVRHNEHIRLPKLQVIFAGKNLGVMDNEAAKALARREGLDLVEVSPNVRPPVCHVTDYGKFIFERNRKKKENAAKQRGCPDKEISFRYTIADGDLQTKSGKIRGFLSKGHRVKCVCKFKSREKAHKEEGVKFLKRVIDLIGDDGVVGSPPVLQGQFVSCRIDPPKMKSKKS